MASPKSKLVPKPEKPTLRERARTLGATAARIRRAAEEAREQSLRADLGPAPPESLFEDLHRPSPSVSCSNTNSAWRGGVESRCGRTGIGRAMKRV
jgi:hypothetical protein